MEFKIVENKITTYQLNRVFTVDVEEELSPLGDDYQYAIWLRHTEYPVKMLVDITWKDRFENDEYSADMRFYMGIYYKDHMNMSSKMNVEDMGKKITVHDILEYHFLNK
jgi:hypothetical protein